MSDLIQLAQEVITHLQNKELDLAIQKIKAAEERQAQVCFQGTVEAIHELNRQIFRLKHEKQQLLNTIQTLPPAERFDAEHHIIPIICQLLDQEINQLVICKRANSKLF